MATYLAFLRAINLGATRKFPKAAIVAATEAAGFSDVATHINTGNVRLETRMRSRARIEAALEAAYAEAAGFEVPTICFTPAELVAVAETGAGFDHEGRRYVYLLKQEPPPSAVRALQERAAAGERIEVAGRAAHLLLETGFHEAKLTGPVVEKHLGVATNRNLTVITTLAEKWCGGGRKGGS